MPIGGRLDDELDCTKLEGRISRTPPNGIPEGAGFVKTAPPAGRHLAGVGRLQRRVHHGVESAPKCSSREEEIRAVKAERSSPAGESLDGPVSAGDTLDQEPRQGFYLPVVSVPFGLLG